MHFGISYQRSFQEEETIVVIGKFTIIMTETNHRSLKENEVWNKIISKAK